MTDCAMYIRVCLLPKYIYHMAEFNEDKGMKNCLSKTLNKILNYNPLQFVINDALKILRD